MAAAWQASGTLLGVAAAGADISPVWPAHATDDIGIVMAACRTTTITCLTPSGYTLLFGPTNSTDTNWRCYGFYKRATSGAEANPLLDWSAESEDRYGQIHTVRGAITTGSPFAATAVTNTTTNPGVSTGVTSTAASQRIIAVGIDGNNAATAAVVTATDPAVWTARHYSTISTGLDAAGYFNDAVRATAGATGNVTHTYTGTPFRWCVLVAAMLDPAAGAVYVPRHPAHDHANPAVF